MSAVTVSHAPAPRLRLTVRGRRVLLALVVVPLIVLAVLTALNGGTATATGAGSSEPLQYVTVEPGQSLWQLAESIAPDVDPREVMGEIRTINALDSVLLEPGQRLAIPTRYTR